ncbi:ComEC/Rec2 family competence protein [Clostridium polynesiense]|uniref:ComEC/Rec2 family competence protein n=1 Tax=Clostridium polynesiense TaxID=1325933 RepID=UPI00069374B1|nr:ComEC/Rec2 family competence protein [Clostridium polynesiense]
MKIIRGRFLSLIFIIALSLGITACGNPVQQNNSEKITGGNTEKSETANKEDNKGKAQLNGNLTVHFIDVGQADSILIQQGEHSMIIDGGNNADAPLVKDYLSKQGVKKLDVVVGTHAHEDHIGALDDVIKAFPVDKIYFPKVEATTKTFENFIKAAKSKNLQFTKPEQGKTFKLGDAVCTIMAPISSKYEGANDYSIVLKVQYGNNSFLFTGDAEAVSEKEMVNKKLDLKADVLKVGHHGSRTSTTSEFLKAVSPKYAVISVEKGNDYKHPHDVVVNRLKKSDVKIYRTDEQGTVKAVSDGNNISFTTSK